MRKRCTAASSPIKSFNLDRFLLSLLLVDQKIHTPAFQSSDLGKLR